MGAGGVVVMSDDLARGVDAGGLAAEGGEGIIDGGENAPAEKEAMGVALRESTDDLPRVVDAECPGVGGEGQGIVDGGEGAAAQEVSVRAVGVAELSDDLAHVVDVECQRGPGAGGRIIERGEGIDRHVVAS